MEQQQQQHRHTHKQRERNGRHSENRNRETMGKIRDTAETVTVAQPDPTSTGASMGSAIVTRGCKSGNRLLTRTARGHKRLTDIGFKREVWNVGWIWLDLGSFSLSANGFMMCSILNGPMWLGVSFLEQLFKWMSVEESQTF